MAIKSTFASHERALAWLAQFDPEDQDAAQAMLKAMLLVSRNEFADRLRALVMHRFAHTKGTIGLYAERELRHREGVPHKLFKETSTKRKRAVGVGPQPVKPTKAFDPETGSEGLVAQLITELCREYPQFLDHPGPDSIRKRKVRNFVVVTDFIGSGKRVHDYLQAAWLVRSVRSWWSLHLLRLEVIAYSATVDGEQFVRSHPCNPQVNLVAACPTVGNSIPVAMREHVRDVCIRYDPLSHDPIGSLGFGGSGALIAFAHGAPNNAPRVFHKSNSRWAPLFPQRVTSGTRAYFGENMDADAVANRLRFMRQSRLAAGPWIKDASERGRALFLVLAALSLGPRQEAAISRRTGLPMLEVAYLIEVATTQGWIGPDLRLTDLGHGELAHARAHDSAPDPLPSNPKPFYYPSSLRAPRQESS